MLAPFGHGLWTAIAGGARAPLPLRKPNGHFHFAAPAIGTYPDLAVLHSPWDSAHLNPIRLHSPARSSRRGREARIYTP